MYVYTHTHTYIHIHMPAHIFTYNYSTLTNSCVCRHFPQTCPQTCFFFWRESCQTFSKKIQICVYIHYWIYNNVPIFSAGLPAIFIFFGVTQPIRTCDMLDICVTWHLYVTWLTPILHACIVWKKKITCQVMFSSVGQHSLICVTSLIHLRTMLCWCVSWLIHMCDMPH